MYEVLSFNRLAEALTRRPVAFDPETPFIQVPGEARRWAEALLQPAGDRPVAVVMPGASSPHRLWPADRYGRVVQWLIARGLYVIVVGGNDVRAMSRQILAGLEREAVPDLTGCTTVAQTAALLARARIYLSADTGVLHIAYGVGTPTVSLFGAGLYRK